MLIASTASLLLGILLDALIGDPQGWPHLVRWIGALISGLEKLLYPMKNKRLAGALLVAIVLLVCTGLPALLLFAAWQLSPWVYLVLAALIIWQCIALKSLKTESRRVYEALAGQDIQKARYAVSMIVGRDTESLDEAGVTRAAVETVAENTSDGIIAPLFYMMLFGAVGGCAYKAINTMDSMIAYKNEKYIDFGRMAAKLDDIVNYIPARISALMMILSAHLCGFRGADAWKIWRRDRRNHASPNSAQTESVVAGALGIQLAGDACYGGTVLKKPYIGDDTRPVKAEDILSSHRLLNATAMIMLLVAVLWRICLYVAF